MEEIYSFMRNNSLSRDKLNYLSGTSKNIHYGDIHTKFSALFDITKERVPYVNSTEELPDLSSGDYCIVGDMIFADASEDMADVGKSIEIIQLSEERLLSGQHTILARRKDDNLAVGFGGHLFRSAWIRSQIQKEAQGTKVYSISSTRLANIEIAYPSERNEQRKIADCLTSLDEVIAAQGRKVEALKTYKRGLMQQLFPREGEAVPRFRFPEFRDESGWEEATIDSRSETFSGGTPETTNKSFYGGTIPFIRSAEIGKANTELFLTAEGLANSAAKIVQYGDVLVALYGANSGDVALARVTGAINQAILCIRPDGNKAFLYHFLTAKKAWIIARYIQGGQGNLSGDIVKSVSLRFPLIEEQGAVADCLSSLDARIADESEKLAALKVHKKGLMQQLFPSHVKV